MKFHTLATAAALIGTLGSAHALNPAQVAAARGNGTLKEVFVSGASALRLSFGAYAQEVCTLKADGTFDHNDFDVYFNGTTGNNSRAYACTLSQQVGNFAIGTPVLIIKRDQSGSAAGIGPVNDRTTLARLSVVDDGTCVAVAGNPSPAVDIQKQSFNCSGSVSTIPDVGISDVEPARFTEAVNLSNGVSAPGIGNLGRFPLALGVFGVVVNPTLYKALQTAQGIVGTPDWAVDQELTDFTKVPSLPSTFVASALLGRLAGGPAASLKKGWNIVLPDATNSQASKTINILRRVEGSGTQAASNLFFAQGLVPAGCVNVASAGCSTAVISVSTSNNATQEYASSGDLETGFATAETLGAFAIGVLSRENNPRAGSPGTTDFDGKQYRYVKIDGVAPIPSEAQTGNYKFVFEASLVYNNVFNAVGSDVQAFAAAVGGANGFGKATTLARADKDTQQGVLALPTYTGAFADLVPAVQKFSSAVSRSAGNSNSPLTRTK